MRKLLLFLTLCLSASLSLAQSANINGILYAAEFGQWTMPTGQNGSYAWSGQNVCVVNSGGLSFQAFTVGTPVTIVDANPSHTETVTPSVVNTSGTGCTVQFSPAPLYAHYSYSLKSGTAGLQEAINWGLRQPSFNSMVEITAEWAWQGGTTGMITAAKGSSTVSIFDFRTAQQQAYTWNGSAYVQVAVDPGAASLAGDNTFTGVNQFTSPANTMYGSFIGSLTGNVIGNVTGNLTGSASQLENKTWEIPGAIGSTTPNTGAFSTLSTMSTTACNFSSLYVAGSPCYATNAAALAAAGSTGWMYIPKNSGTTDAYASGTYKNVIDLRGNFFGVYQYIAPSRPITGYPLGNDLALDVDGPADLVIANGDLGSAITTTATAITATIPTTITVGDSTKFSTAAGYARIDPGKGDGVDDFCTLNSISDSTHMNVTCIYNHSGTVDVWQKGNFVVKGFAALDLVPTQPAHLSAYQFPFYIGSSFASLMSIGVNPSDPWPHNGIAFAEALTGMSSGGANHFPVPADLILRNSDSSHALRVQTSSAGNGLVFTDTEATFGFPVVPATAGGSPYTIGKAAVPWRTAYIGSAAGTYTTVTSNASGVRTWGYPDVSGTGAVYDAAQTWSAKPTFGVGLDANGSGITNVGSLGSVTSIAGSAVSASSGHAVCWKTATTLGFCSTVLAADGTCTCN